MAGLCYHKTQNTTECQDKLMAGLCYHKTQNTTEVLDKRDFPRASRKAKENVKELNGALTLLSWYG